MKDPTVSIVVPVRNSAGTVSETLQALRCQAGAPAVSEIIVVDNGSTDGTKEVVGRFGITLLEERRLGPAAARNRGLRTASGEIIVFVDADTLPTRRWLAELLGPFSDPRVNIVGGKIVSFRPETPAAGYFEQCGFFEPENNIYRKEFPFVPSMNLAVRREPALAIGGWTEELLTAEDVDFCHRLLRKFPSSLVYQPRALLFHRNRTTDGELRRQAWMYGQGAAQMYLRYPEEVRWDLKKSIHLAGVILRRLVMRPIRRWQLLLGRVSPEQVQFAHYHWLWTRAFWGGFFHMYRHRRWSTS